MAHPDSITVGAGETLYSVSRRYNVPIRALIEANSLQPPFGLVAGQRLALPQVQQYVVQPGDTLNNISRRFGVDASTLAKTNKLPAPYTVKLGQPLILPGQVQITSNTPPQLPPNRTPMPPTPPQTMPSGAATGSTPSTVASPPPGPPPLFTQGSPTQQGAPPAAPPIPAPATPIPPVEPPATAAPVQTGRPFQWPVQGPILSAYGPGANGTQNDGINIAASPGSAILAANDGVVAYAGNELRGFGNLVLLKHADGWMTAYAHCESLLVKRGDRVARGQAIAKVGATGAVSEPQLHFELRRGTHALDPMNYLPPPSTASR